MPRIYKPVGPSSNKADKGPAETKAKAPAQNKAPAKGIEKSEKKDSGDK